MRIKGWKQIPLEVAAHIIMGQSPPGTAYNSQEKGVPLLNGPTEFGRVNPIPKQWTTEPTKFADPGDVLFCVRGSSVGRQNLADQRYCIGRGLAAIRGRSEESLTTYLQYVLANIAESVLLEARGAGSTFPNVTSERLHTQMILLPPLAEQKKIAQILFAIDRVIESTQAIINQLQIVKKAMIAELLTKGLPGRHTRFKQTEIGEVPEGWLCSTIGDLGSVQAGRQRSPHFTNGEVRLYLRVANIFDGHIDTGDLLKMPFTESEFSRYQLKVGDILLNEGQSLNLVGRAAVYKGEPKECAFQNTLIRFRAKEKIDSDYAFYLFRFLFYNGTFASIANQTTSIAHLGVSRFAGLKVSVPSLCEQKEIVKTLMSIDVNIDANIQKLDQIKIVKSALMSVLLTGEVRVKVEEGAT